MTGDRRGDASALAGAQLAEILALALIERGIVPKESLCVELDMLVEAHRLDGGGSDLTAALVQLGNSLRAVRNRGDI